MYEPGASVRDFQMARGAWFFADHWLGFPRGWAEVGLGVFHLRRWSFDGPCLWSRQITDNYEETLIFSVEYYVWRYILRVLEFTMEVCVEFSQYGNY